MRGFFIIVLSGILLVGCGRQLPDEPIPDKVITAQQPPAQPTSAVALPTVIREGEVSVTASAQDNQLDEAVATGIANNPTPEPESAEVAETAEADVTEVAEEAADGGTFEGVETGATVLTMQNAEAGAELFNVMVPEVGFSCANCHSVDASEARLVGPGLWNLSQRAEERVADSGAANGFDYIYASIANSNAYIVDTYPEGVMPNTYNEILTEAQLNDLVAYLLTLHD